VCSSDLLGRAQLAGAFVEEVDAARFEIEGVESGAQRLGETALEVFRVGEVGRDRRERGQASRLAVPLRRPDARHVKAGGALTRDSRWAFAAPPTTPLATRRRCAAPPCSAVGLPGARIVALLAFHIRSVFHACPNTLL